MSQTGWLLFFSRANTPKLTFGGSTATPATGITGGFGFGSSAPTSVPSSQAAAPSGFVFGSAGSTSSTTAQSGTTGGFTFSSGTTTQAGTTSFSIGTAAPQAAAAASGLTFGTAVAAAATTAATSGAVTQSTTPFSLGGQSTGGGQGLKGRMVLWAAHGHGGQLGWCGGSAASCFCWGEMERVAAISDFSDVLMQGPQ